MAKTFQVGSGGRGTSSDSGSTDSDTEQDEERRTNDTEDVDETERALREQSEPKGSSSSSTGTTSSGSTAPRGARRAVEEDQARARELERNQNTESESERATEPERRATPREERARRRRRERRLQETVERDQQRSREMTGSRSVDRGRDPRADEQAIAAAMIGSGVDLGQQGIEERGGSLGEQATAFERRVVAESETLTDTNQVRVVKEGDRLTARLTDAGRQRFEEEERARLQRKLTTEAGRQQLVAERINAQYRNAEAYSIESEGDGVVEATVKLESGGTATETFYFPEDADSDDIRIREQDGQLTAYFTTEGQREALRTRIANEQNVSREAVEVTPTEAGEFSVSVNAPRSDPTAGATDNEWVQVAGESNPFETYQTGSDVLAAARDDRLQSTPEPRRVGRVDPFENYQTGTDVLNAADAGRVEEETTTLQSPEEIATERVMASTGLERDQFDVMVRDGRTEVVVTDEGRDELLRDRAEELYFEEGVAVTDGPDGDLQVTRVGQQGTPQQSDAPEQPEQFGDVAWVVPFTGGQRVEDYLDAGSDAYQDVAGNLVNAAPSPLSLQADLYDRVGGGLGDRAASNLREFDRGARQGALALGNVPETVAGLKEGGEFVGWYGARAVNQDVLGRGGFTDRELGLGGSVEANEQRVRADQQIGQAAIAAGGEFQSYVVRNPAEATGAIGTSLAGSALLIGGAARASSTAGRAAAYAIQPGEEVLSASATRLFPRVASRFPNGRIDNEEIVIRGAQRGASRARDVLGGTRARISDRIDVDTDVDVRSRIRERFGRTPASQGIDSDSFGSGISITTTRNPNAGLVEVDPVLRENALRRVVEGQNRVRDVRDAARELPSRSVDALRNRGRVGGEFDVEQAVGSGLVRTQNLAADTRRAAGNVPTRLRDAGLRTAVRGQNFIADSRRGAANTRLAAEGRFGEFIDDTREAGIRSLVRGQNTMYDARAAAGNVPGRLRDAGLRTGVRGQNFGFDARRALGEAPTRARRAGLVGAVRAQNAYIDARGEGLDLVRPDGTGFGVRERVGDGVLRGLVRAENARYDTAVAARSRYEGVQQRLEDTAYRRGYLLGDDARNLWLGARETPLVARSRVANFLEDSRADAWGRRFKMRQDLGRFASRVRSTPFAARNRLELFREDLDAAAYRRGYLLGDDARNLWLGARETPLVARSRVANFLEDARLDTEEIPRGVSSRTERVLGAGLVRARNARADVLNAPSRGGNLIAEAEASIRDATAERLVRAQNFRQDFTVNIGPRRPPRADYSPLEADDMVAFDVSDVDDMAGPSGAGIVSNTLSGSRRPGSSQLLVQMETERGSGVEADTRSVTEMAAESGIDVERALRAEVAFGDRGTSEFFDAMDGTGVEFDPEELAAEALGLGGRGLTSERGAGIEVSLERALGIESEFEFETEVESEWGTEFESAVELETEFETELESEFVDVELETESEPALPQESPRMDAVLDGTGWGTYRNVFRNEVASAREVLGWDE